jgi:hypothetical protein
MSRLSKEIWHCWFCGVRTVDFKETGDYKRGRCRTRRERLIACYSCTTRKGKRSVEEFREMIARRDTRAGIMRTWAMKLGAELKAPAIDSMTPEERLAVDRVRSAVDELLATLPQLPNIRFYGEPDGEEPGRTVIYKGIERLQP